SPTAPFGTVSCRSSLALQPPADQQCHPRNGGNGVVFLPRREAEEAYDYQVPQEEQKIRTLAPRHLRPELAPPSRHFLQRLGKKNGPGNQPQNQQHPEQQ